MKPLVELGRHGLRRIRDYRETRARRLPRLRIAPGSHAGSTEPPAVSRPTVFYLCPDSDRPIGGIRTIYRHVDGLNSVGIRATVLHHRNGFACSWFDHGTPVMEARAVTLTSRDVLVVPEFYGPALHELPVGPRIVILNQGAYQTFIGVSSSSPGAPYRGIPGIEAILVVSRDSADYLRYAFPEFRIERIRNAIDAEIFHPSPVPPGRRVGLMPRKAAGLCAQLLHLLRARGCLGSWEIVNIAGRSERETAAALRSCALFLSLNEREGFGMPPAEAMACGCYVIGFTGLGGREFFDPATSVPVEEGNVLALAKAAEHALLADDKEWETLRKHALTASARILEEYSLRHQQADLVSCFKSLGLG
jgi:glycosyltransferase involved in cell wall biosynthesis